MRIGIGLFIFLSFTYCAFALEGVEILSGYFGVEQKDLEETHSTYQGVPLFLSFDFDLKPTLEKIGITPTGRVDFLLEPFIHTVLKPNDNIEVGTDFLLKYTFPLSDWLCPYLKGGVGISYMSQHTREQSTQYNFVSSGAFGFHFYLKKNLALNLEYRYRHLSNASIKAPNNGINTDFILGGITFFFDAAQGQDN